MWAGGDPSLSFSAELLSYLHGVLCCEGACKAGIHHLLVSTGPIHSATSPSCLFDPGSLLNQGSESVACKGVLTSAKICYLELSSKDTPGNPLQSLTKLKAGFDCPTSASSSFAKKKSKVQPTLQRRKSRPLKNGTDRRRKRCSWTVSFPTDQEYLVKFSRRLPEPLAGTDSAPAGYICRPLHPVASHC